jgi:hypothetical protein
MNGRFLVAIALISTPASASDLLIFHTSYFADSASVDLSLLSNRQSSDRGYDFDVLIGLAETTANGSLHYSDKTAHRARVRCSHPAMILVGGVRYQINLSDSADEADMWKADLWKAVCGVPVS